MTQLLRDSWRKTVPVTFGVIVASFLLAGLAHLMASGVAGQYTAVVARAAMPAVRWLEPVPLELSLSTNGTLIEVHSSVLGGKRLGGFDNTDFSFYVPFLMLLVLLSVALLRQISVTEALMVLLLILSVQVTCISLRVLWTEAREISRPGLALIGSWEMAALQRLARVYCIYGGQLWSGIVVGLLLLRSMATSGRLSSRAARVARSRAAVLTGVAIMISPALIYALAAPPLRVLSGARNEARLAVAQHLFEAARTDSAVKLANQVHDSGDSDIRSLLILARGAHSPAEAGRWWERIATLDPGNIEARFFLAGHRAREQRWSEAIALYQEVLTSRTGDGEVHYQLGNCHLATGNTDRAVHLFRRAAELLPADPRPLAKLALIAHHAGEDCEAARLFGSSLILEPRRDMADRLAKSLRAAKASCRMAERP